MRAVVITGTTSGLGFEILQELKRGRIFTISLNRSVIDQGIKNDHVINLIYDLQDPNLQIFKELEKNLQGVDNVSLILNAATIEPLIAIDKLTISQLQNIFTVNFFSYTDLIRNLFIVSQKCNFQMSIVYIATGATDKFINGWAAYSISKLSLREYCKRFVFENPNVSFQEFDPGIFESKIQNIISSYNEIVMGISSTAKLDTAKEAAFKLVSSLKLF